MTRTQVALLTLGDPARMTGGYLFHRRLADRAARHDARLEFVSIPNLPLPWSMTAGPAWLRHRTLRRSNAVVLDSIAAAAAAPWLSRVRSPIVGMLHQPPGGMDSHPAARAIRAHFDRWAYDRADLLMVASDWLAEQLVAGGIHRERLRVVLPGKDGTAIETTAATERLASRALRHGRRIAALTVANWLPRKGILELLEAVASLPDELVTLHLVGDTTSHVRYARRVRSRLSRRDLRDRTFVHGLTPPAAVAAMYRRVDAFLLPSFEEPYGTVWGEAMAAGLPVVGWSAGNLPFLADHGREALLVPVGHVGALAAAIERLASDRGLRGRLGLAAALRAAARPTWEETAERFFEVIGEVIAARRRGA